MIWPLSTTCEQTASEKRIAVRYRNELIAGSALYIGLLILSLHVVDRVTGTLPKIAVALLPVLGCAAMATAMVRLALRMDELQRKAIVDAAAVALVFTAVIAMALGFLENAGLPRIGMIWVWPIAVFAWGTAFIYLRRRYS